MKNWKKEHRLKSRSVPTVTNWQSLPEHEASKLKQNYYLPMGWGRLIFAHTYDDQSLLIENLRSEKSGTRDIAIYVRDPHVILSQAPQELFLDPSHTYRIQLHHYRPGAQIPVGFNIRFVTKKEDLTEANRIFGAHGMAHIDEAYLWKKRKAKDITLLVAEEVSDGRIIGFVMGVDHVEAFNDPENACSLWCLAVDPKSKHPGVGESLVRHLVEHYHFRGRNYLDLSVMHNNDSAIALYEKLGFERVPVFCIKNRNAFNEPLYAAVDPAQELNPYAEIIVREALRRGISVDVLDAANSYFRLTFGARSITCRESLTEATSAIAMSRCDDKVVTHRVLAQAGLKVPQQKLVTDFETAADMMQKLGSVVVKPVSGEQGQGVAVDLQTDAELRTALSPLIGESGQAIVEEFVEGHDLRIVVIDYQVVAAAIRKPPEVVGSGHHTIRELIEKWNRRRMKETGGESSVPFDRETERCIIQHGYKYATKLPKGETVVLRKTANLHTGGTIEDVTPRLSRDLRAAAIKAARALEIPVVGLDLMVPDVTGSEYYFIEANERPGLANHEPQPTAERFIDFLFPQTADVSRPH